MDQQRSPGGVGARYARDDVGPAGRGLDQLGADAGLGEAGHDPVGGLALVAGRVGGVEADQFGAEADDLVLCLRGGGGGAHAAPAGVVAGAAGACASSSSRVEVPYGLIQPARPSPQYSTKAMISELRAGMPPS